MASLDGAAQRGKLAEGTTRADLLDRLALSTAVEELPADTALVVEAVPERVDLKQTVLGSAARACPEAVLASNTSSLSIAAIAADLPGERVIGTGNAGPCAACHGGLRRAGDTSAKHICDHDTTERRPDSREPRGQVSARRSPPATATPPRSRP